MPSEFDQSNTEKAIAAILRGEQVPVKSRTEQVIQDIIDGKEVTPRSRIEARLCNIGIGKNLQNEVDKLKETKADLQVTKELIADAQLEGAGIDTSNFAHKSDIEAIDNVLLYSSANLFNGEYSEAEPLINANYTKGYISGYSINQSTGELVATADRYVTYPIQVTGGRTIYTKINNPQVLSTVLYMFSYDSDMTYIGKNEQFTSVYELPVNAKYVRILSNSSSQLEYNFLVSYDGNPGTDYEKYSEPHYEVVDNTARSNTKLLSNQLELLENNVNPVLEKVNSSNGIEVILPSIVPCVVGHEMNIYYDNILMGSKFSAIPRMWVTLLSGSESTQLMDRLIINPTEARDLTTRYAKLYDGKTDIQKSFKFICVQPKTSGSISILSIGDSKIEYGHTISKTLAELFTADGVTCNLIGTNGTDYKDEGHSGWSAYEYTQNDVYKNKTNPFWNPVTNEFDFSYYMTNNNFSNVDVVNINLGTNDIAKTTYSTETSMACYNKMIESIHAYDANIIICLGLTENTSQIWTNDYFQTFPQGKDRILVHVKALIERYDNKQSDKIFLSPIYMNMDLTEDYDMIEKPLSSRDTEKKMLIPKDRVHQNIVGFKKNADTIYATIQYALSLQS